ncbi:hemoglobin subunit beta-like isoform X1 [Leucoraja erinacea]|uniref:hemoglobin subunit beta-like isoform X1 n=1 Tax=Leucoraja erinaceus TaxID=7782 RepID=UPI002457EB77|nr:hemoglobin subunit beta-like isoform X1 [Leucoraja erinacea]
MVNITQKEALIIKDIWKRLSKEAITAQALERVFTVYPWTTRLFGSFNHHFKATDAGVQGHARKVAGALETAVAHLDGLDKAFHDLSKKHQTIGVDTQNFKLLGQTFLVELAILFKDGFTPEVHEAAYKFFLAVAGALSSQYH